LIQRLIRQDLAWAGMILLLAAACGLWHQWGLVRLSWKGSLPAYLETQREKRVQARLQGVKTLNLAQAYEIFQQGQALFVDARSPDEYAELHIPGAVNLPPELLDRQGAKALTGIPAEREMVVYCGMLSCNAALNVAEKLESLGFKRLSVFLGGFRAWDEAGYPADTGK